MFAIAEILVEAESDTETDVCVQYVNPACARALSYNSPGELVGRHVDDALTSDQNPIDIYDKIKQQLEAGQVRPRLAPSLAADK